jgi:hypothetical protein
MCDGVRAAATFEVLSPCTGCPSVRNRNLAILPYAASRLQRLIIGHPDRSAGVRPTITNEVTLAHTEMPTPAERQPVYACVSRL